MTLWYIFINAFQNKVKQFDPSINTLSWSSWTQIEPNFVLTLFTPPSQTWTRFVYRQFSHVWCGWWSSSHSMFYAKSFWLWSSVEEHSRATAKKMKGGMYEWRTSALFHPDGSNCLKLTHNLVKHLRAHEKYTQWSLKVLIRIKTAYYS